MESELRQEYKLENSEARGQGPGARVAGSQGRGHSNRQGPGNKGQGHQQGPGPKAEARATGRGQRPRARSHRPGHTQVPGAKGRAWMRSRG